MQRKKVLDWAKEANCYLITDQGLDGNYKYSWQTYDNSEIIFAEKSSDAMGKIYMALGLLYLLLLFIQVMQGRVE